MNAGIQLDDGVYGRRAIITSAWSDTMLGCLTTNGIVELELNTGKGWRGDDLSFLEALPNLKSFKILALGSGIYSIEPIHFLHELRQLQVSTYCDSEIRFDAFPRLEDCSLEWRRKVRSLFECVNLKKLFLNHYSGRDTDSFAKLNRLESLALLNAPIVNVRGLAALQQLRYLRLARLRRLASLSGIDQLTNLEHLTIDTCRRIHSIEEIGRLPRLRRLLLDNGSSIQSLKPVDELKHLEFVSFCGTTNILDGDLSPLTRQEELTLASYQNRNHYSHRREVFQK